MSSSLAYPVQVLQEHITGLEAAMSVCLADPSHKPVHKLRTETRRVEALLLLLALVPDLPEHRKEAAHLLRALGKLRRAAGEVRDFDVHRGMLENLADAQLTSTNGSGPKKPASKKAQAGAATLPDAGKKSALPETAAPELSKFATELRKHLGRNRDKAASTLQEVLRTRQAKTAKAAESLLKALDPAKDLALPAPDLLRNAEAVLTRNGLRNAGDVASLDEDHLHSVRKAAKAARYVAEALPEDASLARAAARFEALQTAGGQWHDALEVARAARRYFGKTHELTAFFREERDRKLNDYRKALSLPELSAPGTRETESPGKRSHRRKSAA